MLIHPAFARWRRLLGRVAVIMELVEEAHRRSRSMVEMIWQFPFTASVSLSLQIEQDGPVTTPATAPHVRAQGVYPMEPENCDHPQTSLYKYGNASGKFRECRQCGTNWSIHDILNPVDRSNIELFQFRMVRNRPGHPEPRPSVGVRSSRRQCSATAKATARRMSEPGFEIVG
jgi:hypothetical protein